MSDTMKEIIARFKVDGVSDFQAGTEKAEKALAGVHGAAAKASHSITGLLKNGLQLSGIAGLLSGVSGGLLAKGALEASANYERLTATFTALSGSAEYAKGSMKWLETFGTKSVFEQEPLQEAATRLEAFGMSASHWLPVISNLAAAFGTDGQNMLEASDALGRLNSGQSGEALESLRRFGIGIDLLSAKGLKFDGAGQLVSDTRTALTAIEQIITEKFGSINDIMGQTLAVKLSNLGDGWTKILRITGDVFSPTVKTVIDSFTEMMNSLTSSGAIQQIATEWVSIFNAPTVIGWLKEGVATIGAGLMIAPQILANVASVGIGLWESVTNAIKSPITGFSPVIEGLTGAITYMGDIFNAGALLLGETITYALNESLKNLPFGLGADFQKANSGTAYGSTRSVLTAQNGMKDLLGPDSTSPGLLAMRSAKMQLDVSSFWLKDAFEPFNKALDASKDAMPGIFDYGKQYKSYMLDVLNTKYPALDAAAPADVYRKSPLGILGQSASNTSRTAENTQQRIQDLRRFVVGGGSLGDAGVTPVAMFGSGRGGMGFTTNQGHIHSAASEFVKYVAQEVMEQQMKLGYGRR